MELHFYLSRKRIEDLCTVKFFHAKIPNPFFFCIDFEMFRNKSDKQKEGITGVIRGKLFFHLVQFVENKEGEKGKKVFFFFILSKEWSNLWWKCFFFLFWIVAGDCSFPAEWHGDWFVDGDEVPFTITEEDFGTRGYCMEELDGFRQTVIYNRFEVRHSFFLDISQQSLLF